MSLFSKILEKLGLKKDQPAVGTGTASGGQKPAPTAAPSKPPAPTSSAPPAPAKPSTPTSPAKPAPPTTPKPAPTAAPPRPAQPAAEEEEVIERRTSATPATATAKAPVAISEVDVVKKLEDLAASKPMKLNWRTSIADLLFLLGIDNSYEARKELAVELGCPPELMTESAKMNTWLHKKVLQEIAANGGNIPKELLD